MNAIRQYLDIITENAGTTVRVFHGSPEAKFALRPGLLYGVRDFGFAASYAVERGDGKGFVHTLDFHFRKLADDDVVEDIAEQLGIDVSNVHSVMLPDETHGGWEVGHGKVTERLKQLGYDGISGFDFGFRSDFEELPVWVVFDATSQVSSVKATLVTADDLKHKHEPD